MELKSINVTYDVNLDYIINKVIPAIKSKYPRAHSPHINIRLQHDNAPAHFNNNDPLWTLMNDEQVGWSFIIKEQPPNSLDTAILDLSFVASTQSIQWGMNPASNIRTDIMHTHWTVWISHQACLNE